MQVGGVPVNTCHSTVTRLHAVNRLPALEGRSKGRHNVIIGMDVKGRPQWPLWPVLWHPVIGAIISANPLRSLPCGCAPMSIGLEVTVLTMADVLIC